MQKKQKIKALNEIAKNYPALLLNKTKLATTVINFPMLSMLKQGFV